MASPSGEFPVLPVVRPVAAPRDGSPVAPVDLAREPSRAAGRGPRVAVVAIAAALALAAVVAAGAIVVRATGITAPGGPRASSASSSGLERRAGSGSLFPAGSDAQLASLRDRLASGLLSLRTKEGDFSTNDGTSVVHPSDRAEATWIAVAALAAARRMGSKVAGLSDAITVAKARALSKQGKTGMPMADMKPKRQAAISAISCSILAFSLGRDAPAGAAQSDADEKTIDATGRLLVAQLTFGAPSAGWVQGVSARALAELSSMGRESLLGDAPSARISVVPARTIRLGAGITDAFRAEALAEEVQRDFGAPESGFPAQVFDRVLADPPTWVGEQSDLDSWLLEAWLAAKRPDGKRWFALVLPQLAAALTPPSGVQDERADGVVPGEYYGYPAKRTAAALLILWEGHAQGT